MGWMVLHSMLEVLKWLIIVRALMSWFVDPYSRNALVVWIRRVTDVVLRPFAALIPPVGGMDLSPLIAIFAIVLIQNAIRMVPY